MRTATLTPVPTIPLLRHLLPADRRGPGTCSFSDPADDDDGTACPGLVVDHLSLHVESAGGAVLRVDLLDAPVCDHHFRQIASELERRMAV